MQAAGLWITDGDMYEPGQKGGIGGGDEKGEIIEKGGEKRRN
jgi:hypothetical protein